MSTSADLVTLAKGDDSRLVEGRRFVFRDPQSFAAVWAAHAGPDASVPDVDFDSRMAAAVFAGEQPTPGYDVSIVGTRRDAGALVLIVDERRPDASAVAAQVLVSPYHVVTLPRDDGDIRFNIEDPTGQGTMVFKPRAPQRSSSQGAAPVPASASKATDGSSSTGLRPEVAAALAYLAGPFSGMLLLAVERSSTFVRFHAWHALIGLGLLGLTVCLFLMLAFVLLIVSPTAFWVMLWMSALTAVAWVGVWLVCLVKAYQGERWKLPYAGRKAEELAR